MKRTDKMVDAGEEAQTRPRMCGKEPIVGSLNFLPRAVGRESWERFELESERVRFVFWLQVGFNTDSIQLIFIE